MEILIHYPIQIEQWIHLLIENFFGANSDNRYTYILGITPEDKNEIDCCYFNNGIEKQIINLTTDTTVFFAKSYSCFKVKNSFHKPTPELFFEAIAKATSDFALG